MTCIKKIDFEKLVCAFVRTVRGTQSQEELSNELKSKFNIVSRWETGRKNVYWDDFLALAQLKHWDLKAILNSVTHFDFSEFPPATEILEQILIPSVKEAVRGNISEQKLNRLAAGTSKLLLSDLLLIFELAYGRSYRFITHFVNNDGKNELSSFFPQKEYIRASKENPLFLFIPLAMQLDAYKSLNTHSDEVLAKALRMPLEEITRGIEALEKAGAIKKEGNLYVSTEAVVDTGDKAIDFKAQIMTHFRDKINETQRAGDPNSDVTSSFLLYGSNPNLDEKVFALCRKFYTDLRILTLEGQKEKSETLRHIALDMFYPFGKSMNDVIRGVAP